MYLVGLTGGIASGKSAVAHRLVDKGCALIDADVIARRVVEPGTEGLARIVDRFGDCVLRADGALDRAALGAIVFADREARADLEAITHPLIGDDVNRQLQEYAGTDRVVVLDVPLLVEGGRSGFDAVVVVASHPDTQMNRMRAERGMTEEDAHARIAAQASVEEKIARADYVIWNEGSFEDLDSRVDEVWFALEAAAAEKAHSEGAGAGESS